LKVGIFAGFLIKGRRGGSISRARSLSDERGPVPEINNSLYSLKDPSKEM
jgi:hypothetical protein